MKKAGNGPYDRSQNMRPNCGIFEREKWSSRDCSTDIRGCLGVILCNKCLLGMHWDGNGRGLRVH